MVLVFEPTWLEMLLILPLAMLVGAIIASVGTVFGDIWHLESAINQPYSNRVLL
jgi:hypothetical protein